MEFQVSNPWDNDPVLASYRSALQRCTDDREKEKLARGAAEYLEKNYTSQPMLFTVESPSVVNVQPGVVQGTMF